MKTLSGFFVAAMALTIAACAAKSEAELAATDTVASAEATPATTVASNSGNPANDLYADGKSKLVKTANYRFEVADAKRSMQAIETAIRKYPAYVASSAQRLDHPMVENKMTLRVQGEYFQELLKDIDQQALHVNFRDINVADVSKEFVDIEARLRVKREVEERYKDILRHKTGNIKDVLEAEAQIAVIQEEIEAAVGRLNYLRNQVNYSTINLEFYQVLETVQATNEGPTVGRQLLDGLRAGWLGMINVLLVLVNIWPLLLIGAGAYVYYRRRAVRPVGTAGPVS